MSSDLASQSPVFQLKASLYTLTTLHLLESALDLLSEQLGKLRHQAPKFFNNAPVIVDLQRLKHDDTSTAFNFTLLKEILHQHQLTIVGLRHVPISWHAHAKEAGFALLPNAAQGKSTGAHSTELASAKSSKVAAVEPRPTPTKPAAKEVATKTEEENNHNTATLLINRSVRSGQQIYAKDADLIVIGSVSPGAEIIADGNIHIYGPLRGRALAGANGNEHARIFCQNLGAELVSIAGHYWLHDDVMAHAKGQSTVQIYLEKEQLHLMKL